jgi:hypothetical protein
MAFLPFELLVDAAFLFSSVIIMIVIPLKDGRCYNNSFYERDL